MEVRTCHSYCIMQCHLSLSAAFWKMNTDERSLWDVTGTNPKDAKVVLTKSMTMTLSTSMSQKKLYSLGSRYIHIEKDRLYNLWNYSYKIDMKTSQLVKGLYIHGEYFIFTKQNCILSFFSPGSQTNTFSYLEVRVGDTNANSLSINAGAWKMCSNKLCFTYDESKSSKKVCIFPAFAK